MAVRAARAPVGAEAHVVGCPARMARLARRRAYDHRLQQLVALGDAHAVNDVQIPRSTLATWQRRGPRHVVSTALVEQSSVRLQLRVAQLERSVRVLAALLRVVLALVRVRGVRLEGQRLPDGNDKATLLTVIARAARTAPLRSVLAVLGLSPERYRAWKRLELTCSLDDRDPCPKSQPARLTSDEVSAMREMVTGTEFRHMPLTTLAEHARRLGRVLAAPATWLRLARQKHWKRPRLRVYAKRPRIGIRAHAPGQILHVDVTVLRLLDGTKAYLQAVLDNFSRKIVAWRLTERFERLLTAELLTEAAELLPSPLRGGQDTLLIADSGIENVNHAVDAVLPAAGLRRLLAQVEVAFSNAMIEARWRSLKHNWLFLNQLDSIATLRRLVAFYVEQHNQVMPHHALGGRTPDEAFYGTAETLKDKLAAAHRVAVRARIDANRQLAVTSSPERRIRQSNE